MMKKNKYALMNPEEQEEVFSNYLLDSWSFSKVSEFSRNEKSFEMTYIYGIYQKKSATTIAGIAYHESLSFYFENKKKGILKDIVDLERVAFDCIENVKHADWKLQKTTPTVQDCILKATKTVTQLLKNFFAEISIYDVKEILYVEEYCNEFLVINGVDIPLPCHAKIDLIVLTNDDKIAVIDHKAKSAFTSNEELSLSIGRQGITYVESVESKTGLKVDEVWFVENKNSQNRDKSDQLNCFKLILDDSVRKLYQALLYEPLRRMLMAVSDPDYIYMINDSDNYVDRAELYDFWAKTMIAEVEDFNVAENKKDMVAKRLKKIRDASISTVSPNIIKKFKENASEFIQYDLTTKDMTQEQMIEHSLRSFGIIVNVSHKFDGYSSNTYLLEVSAGVKISSIYNHRMDIANVLNVSNIRIGKELKMHEGKSYVSIEFSKKRDKDLIFDKSYLQGLKIPIGQDNFGKTVVWDLENHSTPHMLICGATGSGKSNSILSTIEFAKSAGVKNIFVMDPKFEFNEIKGIKSFSEIEEIEIQMEKLVQKMNELVKSKKKEITMLIFDELADAISASKKGSELDIKELVQVGNYAPKKGEFGDGAPKMALKKIGEKKSLEENLQILLQKGRSVGFRIISATQRASVKVITGDAKVNFPVQVCFKVPKETDSRVVIDEAGAECLAGMGDGLFKSPEYQETVRFQAFFKPN